MADEYIKREHAMIRYGDLIKTNTFYTDKGCYTIRIISYKGDLYFHKMLNGKIVELVNLTKTGGEQP